MSSFVTPLEPRRLFAAGDLDLTFGTAGKVDIGSLFSDLHPLPNGQWLVQVGHGVAKFNADGSPAGTVTFTGGQDVVSTLAPLPSGKFLFIAYTTHPDPINERTDITYALERHNADGSLDTSFGDNGTAEGTTVVNSPPKFAVQGDGKILFTTGNDVRRFNADGTLDATFTALGAVSFTPSQLFPRPDGSVVVFGGQEQAGGSGMLALRKLKSDGTIDTAFGDGGVVPVSEPAGSDARDVEVAPDGSIIVSSASIGEFKVRRFTAAGDLDTGFGGDGTVTVPLAARATDEVVSAVRLLADGDILVPAELIGEDGIAGSALLRLNADGTIDQTMPRELARSVGLAPRSIVTTDNRFIYESEAFPGGGGRNVLSAILLDDDPDGPVTLQNGHLFVDGTDDADLITLTAVVDDLVVSRGDGLDRVFFFDDVSIADVNALGGNDIVVLDTSRPVSVSGGDGDDRIVGGSGDDSLSGNAGKDRIDGRGGSDRLAGNGSRDKLSGGDGNDRLFGGSSGDWLAGQAGDDTLMGEGGNDRIDGGIGADFLHGNAGDDSFFAVGDNAIDNLFGDRGHDTSVADETDLLTGIEVVS
jgi:uncharacterized delta-60 repeat protein